MIKKVIKTKQKLLMKEYKSLSTIESPSRLIPKTGSTDIVTTLVVNLVN